MKVLIPPAALTQHIAVLGKTRSGKTNSAKLCIEQVARAGSRVCIIDPIKSDYWGLTSSLDGKKPGLPFHIIGGSHGHVPLHSNAGAAIAEVVAAGSLHLSIIDMEDFGPREAGPFFAKFMETIFKKIVGVLYLIIDEAHLFAPKEGRGGDEAMSTYWFKRMASGAGSKGVRLIVCTQRLQELHNTVLSNCDTVIAHRVTFPEDQKRISDWVASHATKEQVAEVKRSLPNLQRGEAWICSGEVGLFERRQMPLCSTYDNSKTPSEDDKQHKVQTAQIDQTKLRSIIGEAVKEAEANDPKLLRSRIAELEKQLKAKPKPEIDQAAIDRVIKDRDRQWEKSIKEHQSIIDGLKGRISKAAAMLNVNGESVPKMPTPSPQTRRVNDGEADASLHHRQREKALVSDASTNVAKSPRSQTCIVTKQGGSVDGSGLSNYQIDLLDVLVARGPVPTPVGMLATLAKKSRKSSAFSPNLRSLVSSGLATKNREGYLATEEGMELRGSHAAAPISRHAARDYWINRLPAYESGILTVLCNEYPNSLTREEISAMSGRSQTSSAFAPAIRNLIKSGFAIEVDGGTAASDVFFEGAN